MINREAIDVALAQQLVSQQFPQWKHCTIRPVISNGWDNKTFRLGDQMLIRVPSAQAYADQVKKEQQWLPKLAEKLPLAIPKPLAMGRPTDEYPWPWSIYEWIDGQTAQAASIKDLNALAITLAEFLITLQQMDTTDGPPPGAHNFYRGGSLSTYDAQTRQAISLLEGKIDTNAATETWEAALNTRWHGSPVWVHGDISASNLLVKNNALSAVIDFGLLCIGDPACDLSIAWTFFNAESRNIFQEALSLDKDTWARGRAWALWKAAIIVTGLTNATATEVTQSRKVLGTVLPNYNSEL